MPLLTYLVSQLNIAGLLINLSSREFDRSVRDDNLWDLRIVI